MTTTAWVVHRMAGRLRLRLPDRTGDAAFLTDLAESARRLPGVLAVRANPLATSVVIEHEVADRETIDTLLRVLGLELVEGEPPAEPPLRVLAAGLGELERGVRAVSGNAADLRTLGFLALAGAGLVQILRGHPLSAGSSLLWHAADLLRELAPSSGLPARFEPGKERDR